MIEAPPAIQFFTPGRPQTKGSLIAMHRFSPTGNCWTGVREQNGAALSEWRALVATSAKRAMRQQPPFKGPLRVELEFYFNRPKKQTPEQASSPWSLVFKRHDGDKLQRAILDAMTDAAVYWDDSQAVHIEAKKLWADVNHPAGVAVLVEAL